MIKMYILDLNLCIVVCMIKNEDVKLLFLEVRCCYNWRFKVLYGIYY